MDEVVPEEKKPENSSPVSMLDNAMIEKMKVLELRKELGKRGLSKNGVKNMLIARLTEGIEKGVTLLSERPEIEVKNRAGIDFEGGAYWKLLDSKGPEIDESIMEVEGRSFRVPTTTEEE